jgi:pimeloyl-ACP methyl ester carboxylesterase
MEAIRFVKGRRGAEHASIGIVGWSAGTVIARMVAANDRNEVSYLVLLAPPVLPLDEVFINQWKALQALIPKNITDVGMPAEAELRLRTAAYSAAADESKSSEDVKRAIMSVKFTIDPNDRLSPRRVAAIVSNATGELTRSLMAAHAKFKISSTRQPVLAIFGDRDITVDGTANYHAYLKARQQGVPGDAVHLIGALDHSLRRVREERGQLVYAIDPELASLVAKWCKDRVSNRER